MKKTSQTQDSYDMDGINAQRAYEQNPEAQFRTKESMAILTKITKANPAECKYAYYLRMALVDGYSLREIARLEDEPLLLIQRRVNFVTKFLKNEVKKHT